MHRAGPSTSQLQGHAPGGARVWCVCAAIESPSPPLTTSTFTAEHFAQKIHEKSSLHVPKQKVLVRENYL